MRTKIMTLGLICLFIFAYCESPADPEIKKALNPGTLPTIDYFTATHLHSHPQSYGMNSYFELSWSVTNATTLSIDEGVGIVSAEGTTEVQIRETTTYTLTATNDIGQKMASCIAEQPKWAMLEITTIPEPPIFTYHPYTGDDPNPLPYWSNSSSSFIITVTETNGVGGYFSPTLWTYIVGEGRCSKKMSFHKESFEPYSTVKILVGLSVPCRPTIMTIRLEGYDNNNCEIDTSASIPFIWEN